MQIQTHVKSGKLAVNRCETTPPTRPALQVRTNVKAGKLAVNRCETAARH